jgi:subtilisin family serine protease
MTPPCSARPRSNLTRTCLAAIGSVAVCIACVGHARPLVPRGESTRSASSLAPEAKIDPAVKAVIDSGKSAAVIVLGHEQFLERLHGLEQFERAHDGDNRLELRPRVVAELKAIAAREQRVILGSLGKPKAERSLWIANAMALTLTPDEVRRAASLPDVEFIYPSIEQFAEQEPVGKLSLVLPRESRRPFTTSGKRIGWNVERLGAPRVWSELGTRGEGAVVGILDGGANYGHPDLRANVWRNPREIPGNGIDDDHNGYVDDYYGYDFATGHADVRDTTPQRQHGTWTSGIVAGDGTNGIITGVAPRASLMLLIAGGPIENGLAYQYAIENGADIMSMSFSIPNLGNLRGLWRMMSDHAVAAGLVLVGGAGNFQQSAKVPTQIQTPKDIPSVIAVGGVDTASTLVFFSSVGPAEWGSVALYGDYPMPTGLLKPDLVAFPGPNYPVLAAGDSGYIDPNPKIQGNSFSGPQGAGVAALMLSAAPSLPAWRVKQILEETARDLEAPGRDVRTGSGLIDAFAAVRRARAIAGIAVSKSNNVSF